MVTIHVPQYNDNLINIVAYILKNYPIFLYSTDFWPRFYYFFLFL